MSGESDTQMAGFARRKVIVGSVAVPPYTNYGNRLIEKSTFKLLALPESTPKFSVFQKMTDELLEFINSHEYLIITGCTTLQDDPGHQVCFDSQFEKIKIRKVCFGGAFYCESNDNPSLRIARLYDTPIGARDPWTAEYLAKNHIASCLVGCPTLLEGADLVDWKDDPSGFVLVSSSPELMLDYSFLDGRRVRFIKHDSWSRGEELRDSSLFEGASLVITGRLHAALPALARGIRVRFYGQEYWHPDVKPYSWGNMRYSLLQYLKLDLEGNECSAYPAAQIRRLRDNCENWLLQVARS